MNAKRLMVFDSSPPTATDSGESRPEPQEELSTRNSRKRKLSDRLNEKSEENQWPSNKIHADPFAFNLASGVSTEIERGDQSSLKRINITESTSKTITRTTERKALSHSMSLKLSALMERLSFE
jgi:hypothetical protein